MENFPAHRSATVQVPATTANLGPGFDTLGMALTMWNRVQITWGEPSCIVVHGEGEDRLRTDGRNLTYRAAQRLLSEIGCYDADLQIETWNDIPLSRGLGSSASAVVGGLVAANALFDSPVPEPRLLELATELEGHPDNAAPALLGGLCIAVRDGRRVLAAPVPVPPELQCVVFVPEVPLPTRRARAVVPTHFRREDAVYNIGRTALLVTGFATGHAEYFRVATQDRMHQPARQRVFPQMKQLFANALHAGALGVFLSGAGSSVIALTLRGEHRAMTIGYEMADAADKLGLPGQFHVLEPTSEGARVLATEDA